MSNRPPADENVFIRRMRIGRIRQMAVAALSILTAAVVLVALSPSMVGRTAYYGIAAMLVLTAVLALRQCLHIIRPIEILLRRMQGIASSVEHNEFEIDHLYSDADDEFACLAAGMDGLIEKLIEKTRVANERCLHQVAIVRATPFTFFTVSHAGKVFSIIKDHFGLVPFLKLSAGLTPSAAEWGTENFAIYQKSVAKAFEGEGIFWFDMQFPATKDHAEHNLRATVARINEFSALVVMGDMPTIDKIVANQTDKTTQGSRTQKHAALRRLAASVAHDGRNIFAVLNNLVTVNKQSTDPDVREQTSIAEDAIRRGTTLMTELMQYAGETKYQLQCVPAADVCRKLYANPTLRALFPDNIKLVVDVSDEPMPDIDADPEQAWKVSFNLAKNSIEAIGSAPGRIWLTARPFEMTAEAAAGFRTTGPMPYGRGVMTSLVDDGPGIAPGMLDRLFDPYASSKGEGRGLGLATVFSIVEAHNGAIRVRSKPGMGTAFEIFLPASRHSADELKMIRKIAPNGEILLVDDDTAILHTTSLVLRALKIAAHPAANATDAMAKMRTLRNRVRAVIVDAHLANVRLLLLGIRKTYPNTPIILSSGTPEDGLKDLVSPSLYDRFLAKPYAVADIRKALDDDAPAAT